MTTGNQRSEYSLQTRLLTAVSILLFIFLGLTGVVLDRAFRSSVEASVAEQLQAQIYVLLAAVEKDGEAFYFVQDLREPRFTQLNSGLYGLVSSPLGGERLRTPSALEMEFSDFADLWRELERGQMLFTRFDGDDGEYFVAAYSVVWENSGDEFSFAVIESTSTYLAEVNKFRTSLWSWLGGVAMVLLVLQLLLLHWGLTPLRRLAGDLKRMESGNSEELTEHYPRELRTVTDNLNVLIKAERKQQQRYRETLGDLAHSLKTPLAVMTGIMESLARPESDADGPDAREQIRTAQEQLERMNQIIGYQLQRAVSSSGASTLARRVSVSSVAEKIIGALDKVYAGKGMRTRCVVDPAIVFMGDERDLMEVLGNVIDNAYKYGSSELSVTASVDTEPHHSLSIVVEDDGPGISAPDAEFVLQRGARLDTLAQGQGIGLAVVTDIVGSYGGQIEVGVSDLGGARIQLVFNNFQMVP